MSQTLLQQRLLASMEKNVQILPHIVSGLTTAEQTTWRDGPDGWSVLEVVCHLRDYDQIFLERGQLMHTRESPTFPVYDHHKLVIDNAYNQQDCAEVLQALAASRRQFVTFFKTLTPAEWAREGRHVDHGRYTQEALAAHVAWHDANHIEQITRIISKFPKVV